MVGLPVVFLSLEEIPVSNRA